MKHWLEVPAGAWEVLVAMAPYLLLGFLLSGVLAVAVTPDWVRRHMGGRGLWQVVKAALIGVPLPICSCGVIPLGLSLRRHGASRGATVSFVASTPQTGVDSIAASVSMLGPLVALFRVVAAFVSGVLAGMLVEWSERAAGPEAEARQDDTAAAADDARPAWWRRLWRQGFVVLPRDVARPLFVGIVISGAVAVLLPAHTLSTRLPGPALSYLLAMAVGIPLYVCSMSAIPLAAGFIHLGLSPGAALVFLITGPATNAATVMAMWSRVGRRATVCYLLAIALTALAAGWLLDSTFPEAFRNMPQLHEHHATRSIPWRALPAVALLALLLPGLLPRLRAED